MADDRHERIRQRAHAIWEQEGRPEGAHQRHWQQAENDVTAEDAEAAKKPAPAKAAKPAAVKAAAPKAEKPAAKPKAAAKPKPAAAKKG